MHLSQDAYTKHVAYWCGKIQTRLRLISAELAWSMLTEQVLVFLSTNW